MNNVILFSKDKSLNKEIREALKDLPIKIVAEVATVKMAVEAMQVASTKMILVDMFLGEISGLDATKSLKKVDDSLVIILISRLKNRMMIERAFRFGATGYLIYPFQSDTLKNAVLHRLEQIDAESVISFQEQEK
jgi:DNA-binding NarL/FixJ family response regulator